MTKLELEYKEEIKRVQHAIMAEAKPLGVQEEVAVVAALLEAGEIIERPEDPEEPEKRCWHEKAWHRYTKDQRGGLMAQYDLFKHVTSSTTSKWHNWRKICLDTYLERDFTVIGGKVRKAARSKKRILSELKERENDLLLHQDETRRRVLRACISGLIKTGNVFIWLGGGYSDSGQAVRVSEVHWIHNNSSWWHGCVKFNSLVGLENVVKLEDHQRQEHRQIREELSKIKSGFVAGLPGVEEQQPSPIRPVYRRLNFVALVPHSQIKEIDHP